MAHSSFTVLKLVIIAKAGMYIPIASLVAPVIIGPAASAIMSRGNIRPRVWA
jgi:hypothetical protein